MSLIKVRRNLCRFQIRMLAGGLKQTSSWERPGIYRVSPDNSALNTSPEDRTKPPQKVDPGTKQKGHCGWARGLPAAPGKQKLARGHNFHLTKRKLISRPKEETGFFLEAKLSRKL